MAQKTDRDEVIVVDDASTDDTPHIVRRYGDAIRYVRLDTNLGPGGAWAAGLTRSRGEYICKLDADDWHLQDSLERFAERFASDPSVGVVAAAVYGVHEKTEVVQKLPVDAPVGRMDPDTFRQRLLQRFFFHMPGVSVRKAALGNELPRSDLWMPHDWEYFIRTLQGWSCFVLENPIAVYRIHSCSVTRTASQEARLEADLLRLSDLVLDPSSELRLNRKESKLFHRALGETYLRVTRMASLRPNELFRRLSFASELDRKGTSNPLSRFGMVARTFLAKSNSMLSWWRRGSQPALAELVPTPRLGSSADEYVDSPPC